MFDQLPGNGKAKSGTLNVSVVAKIKAAEDREQFPDVLLPDPASAVRNGSLEENVVPEFLPVDFQKSDPFAFIPENGKIRLPFNSLPGVGETASQSIADARDSGVFTIEDLKTSAKLTKSVVDVLRRNGVIDCLNETNQLTLF